MDTKNNIEVSAKSRLAVVGLIAALVVGGFAVSSFVSAAADSGYGYGYGYGYGSTTTDSGSDNGNGGRSGSHRRSSGGGSGEGQVLGASTSTVTTSTSCTEYLLSDLRMGRANPVDEVKKLQLFLNEEMGSGLPVTGFFGPLTFNAVSSFQLKYASEILSPWVPYGLPSASTPTGYVYKTTRHKINEIKCATLNIPLPQLP